jgi:hypothetical protein
MTLNEALVEIRKNINSSHASLFTREDVYAILDYLENDVDIDDDNISYEDVENFLNNIDLEDYTEVKFEIDHSQLLKDFKRELRVE